MAMDIFTDEKKRAALYRLLLALIPVLVAVGVIADDQAQVWLNFLAALSGFGGAALATANTSTKG